MKLFPSRLRPRRHLHDLADAYALDALDEAGRKRFERHLRSCPACTGEVRRLAEVTTAMAMAVAVEPPPGLRDRVMSAVAVTRQLPPEVAEPRRVVALPRSPWLPRLATGIAVAGVAAAVVLGVVQVNVQHRLDTVQAQNQAIAAVLAAPDAQIKSASTSVGGTANVVLSYSERKIVFTGSSLPALPNSKVYELWLISSAAARPAGLLPAANAGKTGPVLAAGLQAGDKVAMTVEPAGGTSSPTTTPILLMTLPNH
ncbi:MAG: anti-sigma factor [Trebonia sp.]